MMSNILQRYRILGLFLFLGYCSSGNEFTKSAASFGLEEAKTFGSGYSIQAYYIPQEEFPAIKKRLLNSLVQENPINREELWNKIQNLNHPHYIAFYLIPETLIIPEYLHFQFEWNGKSINPEFISYASLVQGKVTNEPGFIWMGSPFTFYPPDTRVYHAYSGQRYQSSVDLSWQHSYLFLLIPDKILEKPNSNQLRVISPFAGIADFKWQKMN